MPIDQRKINRMDLTEGKKEVAHAIEGTNVRKSIQELMEIQKQIISDPLKINELTFHGIQLIMERVEKEDIPRLMDLLDSLEYPRMGGETRAAYFSSLRIVSAKMKDLIGVQGVESKIPSEKDVADFIQRIRAWWDDHE